MADSLVVKCSFEGSFRRAPLSDCSLQGLKSLLFSLYGRSDFAVSAPTASASSKAIVTEADLESAAAHAKATASKQPVTLKLSLILAEQSLEKSSGAQLKQKQKKEDKGAWRDHPMLGLYAGVHTRGVHNRRVKEVAAAMPKQLPFTGPFPRVVGSEDTQEQEEDEWVWLSEPSVAAAAAKPRHVAVPKKLTKLYGSGGDSPDTGAVTFTVNGVKRTVTAAEFDVHTSLAEYLRFHLRLTGTKIGCGEGGCGACTVLILHANAPDPTLANACLRPIFSLDGAAVMTTEGIGNMQEPDRTQQAIADCDGTQCGYCTPGVVMAMYGLLSKPTRTDTDVKEAFQGNICRCTGYRPIHKALYSLTDADNKVPVPPVKLTNTTGKRGKSILATEDGVWFNPTSLDEVFITMAAMKDQPQRLVCGNTSTGVVKYYPKVAEDDPTVFINVAHIPELTAITTGVNTVRFGSSVTIANVIKTLETLVAKYPSETTNLAAAARHLHKVAHPQVRETGSWCGNVCLARTHKDFPSDVVLVLATCEAKIRTRNSSGAMIQYDVLDFMNQATPDYTCIVYDVTIPFAEPLQVVDSYKAMQRHANSHPLLNAGFNLRFSGSAPSGYTITSARIVMGNIKRGPFLCNATMLALKGKPLNLATLTQAITALKTEAVCSPRPDTDADFLSGDPAYRQTLAQTLFYKYFLGAMMALQGQLSLDASLRSAPMHYERERPGGEQTWADPPASEAPLGQPIHKLEAMMQTTGAAEYTAEVARPLNTVHGGPVLATQLGTVIAIDPTAALAVKGVTGFVSARDIADIGAVNIMTFYEVFVGSDVSWVGQFVGLVLATSDSIAQRAAKLVHVTYAGSTTAPAPKAFPANSITRSTPPAPTKSENVQLVNSGGAMKTTGQKHFYMETHTCLVEFKQDGTLYVQGSIQSFEFVRSALETMFQLPANQIYICNTRNGGSYGGKAFMPLYLIGVAAVAAKKLKVPVLIQLDRNTDMKAFGARVSCEAAFSSYVDPTTYKIASMEVTAHVNAGNNVGYGHYPCTVLCGYDVPGAKLTSIPYETKASVNTIMRAPGDFQGALFTEATIEAAMYAMNVTGTLAQLAVQEANMNALAVPVWNTMKSTVDVAALAESVDAFNKVNKWRKRGWYCMPCYYVGDSTTFLQTLYLTVHADSSITVNHSGLETGQGINTKVWQAIAYGLSKTAPVGLDMIVTTKLKSSTEFPGVSPTWGSATSEAVVLAAIRACDELNIRLAPFKASGKSWKQVVADAVASGVVLTAQTGFDPTDDGTQYPVTSAAATVVELDVLTGENQVLSFDLFFDGGVSLNPAVDIGQIEGSVIQGLGFVLTEEQVRDPTNHRLISNGTWEYKPPSSMDIPIDFNVTFVPSTNDNPRAVMGSKCTGEPTQMLAVSVLFALKNAIYATRKERGVEGYFQMDCPASPERTALACAVDLE